MEQRCPNHPDFVRRLEKCEQEIADLKDRDTEVQVKQASIDQKLDNLLQIVMELKAKVDELAKVPSRRWDTVINTIITVIVSMGVGAAVAVVLK